MQDDVTGDGIELVSDGEGLAVIGDPSAVERFMAATGLAHDVAAGNAARALSVGSGVAQAASRASEGSGRWVKLTKESAEHVRNFGLTPTKTPGISHAMIGQPGRTRKWIQIERGPGSVMTNPATLANLGGIMSQMAMQQQLDAITDYLAKIDEKLDDLIRAQMNQVLARVDAVGLALGEAMKVREEVGQVSEVTWSKVQGQPTTILETQAFALRQMADLVARFERKHKVADLAKISKEVEDEIAKWLSILARCFQLHEAHALLELDRVMGASPDDLDRHRRGLQAARRGRVELFERATQQVLDRINEAATTANSKVLFNPGQSPAVVESRNCIVAEVDDFREVLGLESGAESSEARRWKDAASDQVGRARDTGAQGIDVAKRFGSQTRKRASSVRGRIGEGIAGRRQSLETDEPLEPGDGGQTDPG